MAKKKSLEGSMEQLEDIVSKLESGEFTLDESLKKFEEGIKLYNECKSFLANAETKIKTLSEEFKE